MSGPHYTEEHHAFRDTVRRFVESEIMPQVDAWEDARSFPRELYRKAGALGLLAIGMPADYGGIPGDPFLSLVVTQELARAGSGGLSASLMSHTIGMPPLIAAGREELKARILPEVVAGRMISALAVTEAGGGSDVAAIRARAVRDGDDYVLSGEKTYITSGMRADVITVLARTGGDSAGALTLFLVEDDPRIARTPLGKMGWHPSDTATLHFDDVRIPIANRLGEEGQGFRIVMRTFNSERLTMAANAAAFSDVCLQDSIVWAKERRTFGQRLIDHQVIRHKLVDMAMRIAATQALVDRLAQAVRDGEEPVAEIAMAKNQATRTMAFCASEAVQIHGGAGYMHGLRVERIYREVKVNAIGGGAEEVLKELVARRMGWV
ncbi:MAG: acyl-CoA dehydrogenase family protein [Pseudomonadota bacterium]|nr:acyl-CoA dehydrogenase family protein [Pseudomonadota bacterium]